MTVLVVALFAMSALASLGLVASAWNVYGQEAMALPAAIEGSPGTLRITWTLTERLGSEPGAVAQAPVGASLAGPVRPDRCVRLRLPRRAPAPAWPVLRAA